MHTLKMCAKIKQQLKPKGNHHAKKIYFIQYSS